MTETRVFGISLLALLLCSASLRLPAQSTTTAFVIDPNRPYVYLKLDHIAPGIPRSEGEPSARIWLHLRNNCRVPIIVRTYGLPDGSPEEEQGVMDRIVLNSEIWGQSYGLSGITSDGTVVPKPLTKPRADEIPHDYWFEVGSFQSIPPGKGLFFSVPVNHVEQRWHFEIPFRFELPKGERSYDPNVGGLPEMFITYSIFDLPPEQRSKIAP